VVAFIYGTKLVSERKSLEAMYAGELNIETKKKKEEVELNSMIIAQE